MGGRGPRPDRRSVRPIRVGRPVVRQALPADLAARRSTAATPRRTPPTPGPGPSSKGAGFAEGEQEKVLQVTRQILELGIARPILIGRCETVEEQIAALGLVLVPGRDFSLLDPEDNPNFSEHRDEFYNHVKRRGYSPQKPGNTCAAMNAPEV